MNLNLVIERECSRDHQTALRQFLCCEPGGVVGVAGGCCSTSVGASISIGCSDVVGSCCVGVGNVDGVYAGSFWLPIVVFFLLAFFDGLSSLVS